MSLTLKDAWEGVWCLGCEQHKSPDEFYTNGRGGLTARCKPCKVRQVAETRRKRNPPKRTKDPYLYLGLRECSECQLVQPLEDFNKKADCYGGRTARCKGCAQRYTRANNARKPEAHQKRWRSRLLRESYNMTLDEYDAMLEMQGGGCAICGNECTSGRRLAVDHCHSTGRVRGLLCSRCNTTIGQAEDDVRLLGAMIDYLGHHK